MSHLPRWAACVILLLLAGTPAAFAHAILVRSTPADQSVVHSHQVQMALEYNSRIEASRCTLTLTNLAGTPVPLQMEHSAKSWELKAAANHLVDGKYQIHWQVLASDGHITRGDVTFTVAAK